MIHVECSICDRRGSYERAALVKMFGTSLNFSRLRQRAAMGCERMTGPDGDLCGTNFPCLERVPVIGDAMIVPGGRLFVWM
jgi:hypothetical protein